jgi:DNA-binding beta-propeller fold protein YncE
MGEVQYDANLTTTVDLSGVPNPGPFFMAFDGANLWVVNYGTPNFASGTTVTKLRGNDGAILGRFPSGGIGPNAIAFDGANLWVTNQSSNTVAKLRATDGALLGTFPVGGLSSVGCF